MKKLRFLPLPVLACGALLLGGCKGGAGKVTGNWKSADAVTREALDNDQVGNRLIIREVNDRFAVYPKSTPADSLMYSYDEKNARLVATHNDATFYIHKEKQTGHLVLTVEGFPDRKLELEKAD